MTAAPTESSNPGPVPTTIPLESGNGGSHTAHSLGSADCWVPMGPGHPHPKDMASPESSRQHLHLCQRWCKHSAHCPCLHRRKEGHSADPKDMSQGGDPALAHNYLQQVFPKCTTRRGPQWDIDLPIGLEDKWGSGQIPSQ